jgi:hypothetical protein
MAEEIDPIGDYLASKNVGFQTTEGGAHGYKTHSFHFTGKSINIIECAIEFAEEGRVFTVYGMVNNKVPKEKFLEVLKVINEANLSTGYGTMVLNMSDGNFWARNTHAAANDVDPSVYDAMIIHVCDLIDRIYPLIMKIIYSEKSAEEVIANWKSGSDKSSDSPISSDISGYQ